MGALQIAIFDLVSTHGHKSAHTMVMGGSRGGTGDPDPPENL